MQAKDQAMTIGQRVAAFLTALDAASDPAQADRERIRLLEKRVQQMEDGAQSGGLRN